MQSEIHQGNHSSEILIRGTAGNFSAKTTPIDSLFTLRKLQKILLIPRNLHPTETKRKELYLGNPTANRKYLLISTRNVIYYGLLSTEGFPQDARAVCIFAQGSYFQGSFKNGKPDGEGRLSNLQCSYVYEGEWKNGMPHGNGSQMIDNNYYLGEFFEGRKHGYGSQTYADGSRFQGHFQNNIIQGEGRYVNSTNIWSGNWKDGYLDGQGQQIIAKQNLKDLEGASEYRGEFKKGEKDGRGVFKWHNKYQYDGEFKKGQLHGEGIFKFKGRIYSGEWLNGTEVRINEIRANNSSVSKASYASRPSSSQKQRQKSDQ